MEIGAMDRNETGREDVYIMSRGFHFNQMTTKCFIEKVRSGTTEG
jgi:hypothetical protein